MQIATRHHHRKGKNAKIFVYIIMHLRREGDIERGDNFQYMCSYSNRLLHMQAFFLNSFLSRTM